MDQEGRLDRADEGRGRPLIEAAAKDYVEEGRLAEAHRALREVVLI
jgi:hypothetical protein